jgi:hypothetical protein
MSAPTPSLTYAQLGDLQQTTLPELNRFSITEIATDIQQFTVLNMLLRKGSTITVDDGKSFQWTVLVDDTDSAAWVGAGYQDKVSIKDVTTLATADWRNCKVDWAVVAQEVQMNSGKSRIVDERLLREKAAAIALVRLLERGFWGPPVALADGLTGWGANTWLVKNGSEGFNGGPPSGYTTIGLNPTTFPRWKNYTAPYTTVDDGDFVDKTNRMAYRTDWKPPVEGLPILAPGNRRMYFTNLTLLLQLEQLLKASNQDLGMDILHYNGKTLINNTPLVWVPFLDADSTNPLYQIAMDDFKLYRLKNFWMRRTQLPHTPNRHTVASDYLDNTMQWVMVNRRRSGVVSNGTTYPS